MNAVAWRTVDWIDPYHSTVVASQQQNWMSGRASSYTLSEIKHQANGWITPVVVRLYELMSLSDNWDSYGARRIDTKAVNQFLTTLAMIMKDNTPPPSVVPSPTGHLQAEWHERGIDLEVEVISPSLISVSFSDSRGRAHWAEDLQADLTKLSTAIHVLSLRA